MPPIDVCLGLARTIHVYVYTVSIRCFGREIHTVIHTYIQSYTECVFGQPYIPYFTYTQINLDNALMRFEFLEALVRTAIVKVDFCNHWKYCLY